MPRPRAHHAVLGREERVRALRGDSRGAGRPGGIRMRGRKDIFKYFVQVYGLSYMSLLRSSRLARYMETHVGRVDLEGFVSEVGRICTSVMYKCTV